MYTGVYKLSFRSLVTSARFSAVGAIRYTPGVSGMGVRFDARLRCRVTCLSSVSYSHVLGSGLTPAALRSFMRSTADITLRAWVSRTSTFHSMSAVFAVAVVSSGASTSWMGALRLPRVSGDSSAQQEYCHSLEYALDGSYHVSSVVSRSVQESRIPIWRSRSERAIVVSWWHPPLVTLIACGGRGEESARRTLDAHDLERRHCGASACPRSCSAVPDSLVMQLELARPPHQGLARRATWRPGSL
jgi:hypothetical protein